MPHFNVSLLTDVEVAGSVTVDAPSKEAAVAQARVLHAQAQVPWLYGSSPIGAFTGPLKRVWAIPAGEGRFSVSLTAHVRISVVVPAVEAKDEKEALQKARADHSKAVLPWSFRGVKLGAFTGSFSNIWTSPAPDPPPPPPLRHPTVTTLDIVPDPNFVYLPTAFDVRVEASVGIPQGDALIIVTQQDTTPLPPIPEPPPVVGTRLLEWSFNEGNGANSFANDGTAGPPGALDIVQAGASTWAGCSGIVFDGTYLWVSDGDSSGSSNSPDPRTRTIVVLDPSTNPPELVDTIDLSSFAPFQNVRTLRMSQDGLHVFASAKSASSYGGGPGGPGPASAGASISVSGGTVTVSSISQTSQEGITSITISGAANSANNGTFPVLTVVDGQSVVIDNPSAAADANNGNLTWVLHRPPGMVIVFSVATRLPVGVAQLNPGFVGGPAGTGYWSAGARDSVDDGAGNLWAVNSNYSTSNAMERFSLAAVIANGPGTPTTSAQIITIANHAEELCFGAGYIWTGGAAYTSRVTRIDPVTGATTSSTGAFTYSYWGMTFAFGALWMGDFGGSGGKVYRFDPATWGTPSFVPTDSLHSPNWNDNQNAFASDGTFLWYGDLGATRGVTDVCKIDPTPGSVAIVATVQLTGPTGRNSGVEALAFDGRSIWGTRRFSSPRSSLCQIVTTPGSEAVVWNSWAGPSQTSIGYPGEGSSDKIYAGQASYPGAGSGSGLLFIPDSSHGDTWLATGENVVPSSTSAFSFAGWMIPSRPLGVGDVPRILSKWLDPIGSALVPAPPVGGGGGGGGGRIGLRPTLAWEALSLIMIPDSVVSGTSDGFAVLGADALDGTVATLASYGTGLSTGDWHHVAFTYNSGIGNLYLDGTLVDTTAGGPANVLWGTGFWSVGGAPIAKGSFFGGLDQWAFWDGVALSAQDVTDLFNSVPITPRLGRGFDPRMFPQWSGVMADHPEPPYVLAQVTLDQDGNASFVTSSLDPGTYTCVAQYVGQGLYDPSVSEPIGEIIESYPAGVRLIVLDNPGTIGVPTKLRGFVHPTATGTVDFYRETTGVPVLLGSGALNPATGTGSLSIALTHNGSDPDPVFIRLHCFYSGDLDNPPATSSIESLLVTLPATVTTLFTRDALNEADSNASVPFAADVHPQSGSGPNPTGYVTLEQLVSGVWTPVASNLLGGNEGDPAYRAALSAGPFAAGVYQFRAVYAGDSSYLGSTSDEWTETITQGPVLTYVVAGAARAGDGNTVVSGNVYESFSGLPVTQGTVTVNVIGYGLYGPYALDGAGFFTTPEIPLTAGNWPIDVNYGGYDSGTTHIASSESFFYFNIVNPTATAHVLSYTLDPGCRTVVMNMQVTPDASDPVVPTGTVHVHCYDYSSGQYLEVGTSTALDGSGDCSITFSQDPFGHTLYMYVDYNGDGHYAGNPGTYAYVYLAFRGLNATSVYPEYNPSTGFMQWRGYCSGSPDVGPAVGTFYVSTSIDAGGSVGASKPVGNFYQDVQLPFTGEFFTDPVHLPSNCTGIFTGMSDGSVHGYGGGSLNSPYGGYSSGDPRTTAVTVNSATYNAGTDHVDFDITVSSTGSGSGTLASNGSSFGQGIAFTYNQWPIGFTRGYWQQNGTVDAGGHCVVSIPAPNPERTDGTVRFGIYYPGNANYVGSFAEIYVAIPAHAKRPVKFTGLNASYNSTYDYILIGGSVSLVTPDPGAYYTQDATTNTTWYGVHPPYDYEIDVILISAPAGALALGINGACLTGGLPAVVNKSSLGAQSIYSPDGVYTAFRFGTGYPNPGTVAGTYTFQVRYNGNAIDSAITSSVISIDIPGLISNVSYGTPTGSYAHSPHWGPYPDQPVKFTGTVQNPHGPTAPSGIATLYVDGVAVATGPLTPYSGNIAQVDFGNLGPFAAGDHTYYVQAGSDSSSVQTFRTGWPVVMFAGYVDCYLYAADPDNPTVQLDSGPPNYTPVYPHGIPTGTASGSGHWYAGGYWTGGPDAVVVGGAQPLFPPRLQLTTQSNGGSQYGGGYFDCSYTPDGASQYLAGYAYSYF